MASPSGKKDGLRCECGRLLIEKDPVAGFGVRCGRRECDKFHPLEEIDQRAAEFGKQKERKKEEMGERVLMVTLKRKADPTGNWYDRNYGGPPIIVIEITPSSGKFSDEEYKKNAQKISDGLLNHLDWETRRELGKLLSLVYPANLKEI